MGLFTLFNRKNGHMNGVDVNNASTTHINPDIPEDLLIEIDFHIASRSRSGLIDTVEELNMKKEIAESHVKKVIEIENDAKNNRGDSQGIIMSYTRGFKNGLAAISHHSILNRKL